MLERRVIIESPYRGKDYEQTELNLEYARACMKDCLIMHRENPFASHLLYTQPGILDDKNPEERARGIAAGWDWAQSAEASVVYLDLIDNWEHFEGIVKGIKDARFQGREVEFRNLPDETLNKLDPDLIKRRRDPNDLIRELDALLAQ